MREPLPENLLPAEALLLKPTPEEIRNNDLRMIHLSTPLLESEQKLLKALDEECKKQKITIPRSMQPHSLRVIQQHKGKIKSALEQLTKNYEFRMKYLPLTEAEVLADLQKGWMYWHGRDKRCRPILVVRAGNIDKETWANPERITKMVLFLLEFILRYGMVPGRVENWCVMVDLTNAGRHGRPSMEAVKTMAHAMQGIYRYRMAWTKILNAPFWFSVFWSGLKSVLPGESVKKVEICSGSYHKALHAVVALNQLEERYGGTCRDRETPSQFYPMQFPAGPFDPQAPVLRKDPSPRGGVASDDIHTKLHDYTPVTLHEGGLWIEGKEDKWLASARMAPLTKEASDYLKARNVQLNPCETYQDLLNLLHQSQEDCTDATSEDSKHQTKSSPVTSRKDEEVFASGSMKSKAKEESERNSLRDAASTGITLNIESDRGSKRLNGGSEVRETLAEQLSRDKDKIPSRDRKSNTMLVEVQNPVTGGVETVEVEQTPEPQAIPSRASRDRDLGDQKDAYGTCSWCSCKPCGR